MTFHKLLSVLFSFLLLVAACQPQTSSETDTTDPTANLPTVETVTLTHYFPDSLLNRFQPDINAFMQEDSLNTLPTSGALFVGSSSIRFWDSLSSDMAPVPVINRGFGGSTLPEVLHYFNQLVPVHKPQVIVLYAGENDLTLEGAGITPESVLETFQIFVNSVKDTLPDTKVYFISAKPSPARWSLWPQFQQANQLIREYATTQDNVVFVDVADAMLQPDSTVKKDIFVADSLHMNRQGYALWTKLIRPQLLDDFDFASANP